jgi:hypothetical protein
MLKEYNRVKAFEYANKWALSRNPMYYDYSDLGGDCTNFCSQVIHAGGCSMNYSSRGWYYRNGNDKSPSWTGVNYFYQFLVKNKETGPIAEEVDTRDIKIGDIIQLSFVENNSYNHSLVVTKYGFSPSISNIKVCTHTDDQCFYSLTNYDWTKIRFLHIIGYK